MVLFCISYTVVSKDLEISERTLFYQYTINIEYIYINILSMKIANQNKYGEILTPSFISVMHSLILQVVLNQLVFLERKTGCFYLHLSQTFLNRK